MGGFSEMVQRVIDCHVHLGDLASLKNLMDVRQRLGVAMNLVSIANPGTGAGHAQGLCAKLAAPGSFWCFGGLNHARLASDDAVHAPPLEAQADSMLAAGCDGIKLIEGKPTFRRDHPLRLDGKYFGGFFARCEEVNAPLLWHVADPEEFWDPSRLPDWAARAGWGYSQHDVPKEQLYREVANVLDRHGRLRVVFAHFYFLSADLGRAEEFLARYPNAHFDLAPGVEMLFNLSRDPRRSREFFLRHCQRIFFGTDISGHQTPEHAAARAELVRRFLESDETFTVPPEADGLLDPGSGAEIRGLALPQEALECIYFRNFQAFAGEKPRCVNLDAARRDIARQASVAAAISRKPAEQTEAGRCLAALETIARGEELNLSPVPGRRSGDR